MRDESSSGTADDSALLAGSKKLDDLKNALESSKEGQQLEAMKKVIGYIAKGTVQPRKPYEMCWKRTDLSRETLKVKQV